MNRPTQPHHIAEMYLEHGVRGDDLGTWLFAQGDDVHWCAAFALQCCRESGNWLEQKIADRAQMRTVSVLVERARQRGQLVNPTRNDHKLWTELASGRWAGVLAVFERDGNPYGHVGVVDLGVLVHDTSNFVCIEGNMGDRVREQLRRFEEVTAWVLVPWGAPIG